MSSFGAVIAIKIVQIKSLSGFLSAGKQLKWSVEMLEIYDAE
jgi:hypothetical protein